MATTITSDVLGKLEIAQADGAAYFQYACRLFEAVWSVDAKDSYKVNFPVFPAPSTTGLTSAATESVDPTGSQVSIAQQLLQLLPYSKMAPLSQAAIEGGNGVDAAVYQSMLNDIGLAIDRLICQQFDTAYTLTGVSSCITVSAFLSALTSLRDTGYSGQPRAILTEYMAGKIIADAGGKFYPQKNEEFMSAGYLGNLFGVETWTVPSGIVLQTASKATGLMWFHGVGPALAYHSPLINLKAIEKHTFTELSVTAHVVASELSATGGIRLYSDTTV